MGAEIVCFFGNVNYEGDFLQTFLEFPTNFVDYISRPQLEKYFLFLFLLFAFLKTLNMVNHAKRECLVYNKHCKNEIIYLLCQ